MKKIFYSIPFMLVGLVALTFSSCLKDKTYVDVSKSGTNVNFPLGGLYNFSSDAITETPDTDANGTIVRAFSVNVASVNVPTTATTVTFTVDDAATIAAYNAANPAVVYEAMPANAYKFTTTTLTVPSGQQYANTSVTFYKNLLDPSKSYMLPITISKTTNGIIASNLSTHYYHFIGNDFAGSYEQTFERWNASDSTSAALNGNSYLTPQPAIFNPVTPTEFTVYTGYDGGGAIHYDVTFTKTVTGGVASYTNFHVAILAADVTAIAPTITIAQQPVFFDPATGKLLTATLDGPYTFAQAVKLFHFQFQAMTTAPRYLKDSFVK